MRQTIYIVLLFTTLSSVPLSCRKTTDAPFRVDTARGEFYFQSGSEQQPGLSMELNGTDPLKGGHLFYYRDSLVCIQTVKDLDMIMVFGTESPGTGSLRVRIVNTADDRQEISRLVFLDAVTGMELPFTARVKENAAWVTRQDVQNGRSRIWLDLPSPIVLTAGEEITFDKLVFQQKSRGIND